MRPYGAVRKDNPGGGEIGRDRQTDRDDIMATHMGRWLDEYILDSIAKEKHDQISFLLVKKGRGMKIEYIMLVDSRVRA